MKLNRILMVLCIVVAVSVFVCGITALSYAKSGPDITDTKGGTGEIEKQMPRAGEKDKGSPMHAWKAIVASGKKAGDIITAKEFAGMRNWSARTRGYELQSLIAIGVLAPTGNKGEYEILTNATPKQIDQINDEAKAVVGKTGRDGIALGIDSYRLDADYLGEDKLGQITAIINKVTGSTVAPGAVVSNFVQSDIDRGVDLPASVAINGDMPFTINGISLEKIEGIDNVIEQQDLLAALVDTRIVSPEAKTKGDVADFSAVKAKTVMFKDEFVTGVPSAFKTEFDKLGQDETAVIIVINKNDEDIRAALKQAGLAEEWGNRIIVMGVKPESPSAHAFGVLFGNNNIIDLRGQTIDKILENKDLVAGLKGGV